MSGIKDRSVMDDIPEIRELEREREDQDSRKSYYERMELPVPGKDDEDDSD